jgi:excisionase family DNA binding protein
VDRQASAALPASKVRRGVAETLLLTLEEAGAELRVSEDTVERMVAEGDLLAVRVGKKGRRRIRRADLERFVARLKTTREMGAATWR